MRPRDLLRYRKDPRVVVTVPLLILVATSLVYYLVQRAKELSPEALSSRLLLFVLWNINLILILGILFVLLRGVIKLVLERHRGILGSRFRTKLVVTYILISLFPIALLFFVATDLLRVSVDRWFNMPVRTLMRNSERIAQMAQDRAISQAERAASEAAASIGGGGQIDRVLSHVRQFHQVDLIGAYQNGGLVRSLGNPRSPIHTIREPSAKFFEEIRERGFARKIDVTPAGNWIRYGVPIGGGGERAAVAGVFLPMATSRLIDANLIAYQNFLRLDAQRPALKAGQTSLLLAVTLFFLFGSLWLAIIVSRRITVPIQALAEGTRKLAAGSYGQRVEVSATDEIGMLVDSFNQMSGELRSQRDALTETARRLDQERAFLFTVMESVSTGIIAVDDRLALLTINPAALAILRLDGIPRETPLDQALREELPELAEYFAELREREPRSREITAVRAGELRYLEVSAARLSSAGGHGGWVVALEDLTQLVQAQKLAAWSEAARRIAHEIKNPLTPIQLSAERIARKFTGQEGDVDAVIDEGTRTIISEVGQLKRMVDEFSRFARMPAVNLRQTHIEQILREVARLYSELKPGVTVSVDADPALQAVVDPEQIRRALINLLDNAVEATERGEIALRARLRERTLVLEVSDPGRGVPDADKDKLFLPYFSTKGRDTGLGLAIVHRIVHDHDGRISVHDNQPQGTRFEIEIPA